MLLSILKIVLAPVLAVQGRQVKKNTPRLPEAKGPRKGIQENGGKQIRLLILGDSAAAGVGVDHQDHADCEFMEFDLPMDASLMAGDGFHPGPGLHTIWGQEIFKRISLHFPAD